MTGTKCEEKERLINDYAKASAELADSIAALKKSEGTSPKDEYDALGRAAEDAHMRNEQARLAFERHQQDHKC
ncbi:MAG: hypothetical protein ABI759_10730 [Candidatus Solibacter sp.]